MAAAGAYVCYDGAGRAKYWPDSLLVHCLLQVAAAGHSERLLLGADVARRSAFRAYGGAPGLAHLPERFVPRLVAAGGQALVDRLLVDNPARLLAIESASAGSDDR